ncbi:MAG: hypothetical protein IJS81_12785 [Selenomonadaceae bacterium]|nr:hypothetical protein [Selenomonadaceae bacterium]
MGRKIFVFITALIFTLTIFSVTNANGQWRLDGVPDKFPRSFRFMTDDWKVDIYYNPPSREGLENFHASASGQPTLSELKNIFDEIKKVAPNDKKIYIVDLRQESHGFADEYPVSWYVKKNRANVDKTFSEIELDEKSRLENLRGKFTKFVPLGNYDTKHFQEITFAPKNTLTEKQAAESAGFNYARFYALDMTFPAPEVVDEYLKFLSQIDSETWLHFHCHAGHGRTTIFLVMYDILQHPDLALEDILRRQFLLGGSNLFDGGDKEKYIRKFYEYAHENSNLTWSRWLLNN